MRPLQDAFKQHWSRHNIPYIGWSLARNFCQTEYEAIARRPHVRTWWKLVSKMNAAGFDSLRMSRDNDRENDGEQGLREEMRFRAGWEYVIFMQFCFPSCAVDGWYVWYQVVWYTVQYPINISKKREVLGVKDTKLVAEEYPKHVVLITLFCLAHNSSSLNNTMMESRICARRWGAEHVGIIWYIYIYIFTYVCASLFFELRYLW